MGKAKSMLQSHGGYIDIIMGASLVGIFVYMLIFNGLLLGAVISITVPLTIYVPLRQGKHAHILPVVLGWGTSIYGYYSTRQFVISLILGIAVYIALMLYRSTENLTGPDKTG